MTSLFQRTNMPSPLHHDNSVVDDIWKPKLITQLDEKCDRCKEVVKDNLWIIHTIHYQFLGGLQPENLCVEQSKNLIIRLCQNCWKYIYYQATNLRPITD